jgi:hypothetical protein
VGAFDFLYSWIFLPPIFLLDFFFVVNRDGEGHCPWIIFSQIYFTFFMIYASRLRFYEPFFSMWSSVFVLCCCFFLNLMSIQCITCNTGHIHCSIVDKIEPTSEYVEMVKTNALSITLGYIFLWNVIRTNYLPCLQLISKNTFDEPWRGPSLFLASKVEEWLMMTFVLENCLLDLFVVLDWNLRSILIDNSFFFVSKIGNKYYLFYLFLTTVWKMSFSVRV